MIMKKYGINQQQQLDSKIDFHLENLKIKGFSIENSLLSLSLCDDLALHLETVYQSQELSFGKSNLQAINELDVARMPFFYHNIFFDLFLNELVLEIVEKIIGKAFHLHLQNGIINRPQKEHHQTSWHRDLPYQDWVISKPLAINAFYCLSEFTHENGATFVLPYSHKLDYFPSSQFVNENQMQIIAPKGSVIFFDSMLYHRAGINSSSHVRYGINNMFVVPIIKQQINISEYFSGKQLDAQVSKILGITYHTPKDVEDFRARRLKK